jgi:mono/diheme cytochrome c family protein
MHKLGWFLLGALSAFLLAFVAGMLSLGRAHGFSAREQPMGLEAWIASQIRFAAMPSDAKTRANPVPNTPEVLAEARAHWADHCATCHANDGSGDTPMGQHTYPPAPDMRKPTTQQMTDGELFYIIQNGIRLSAMPAWGGAAGSSNQHDEEDSWKLVHFIRHLPELTADEKIEMRRLNPKGPEDLKEEEEEQKFLKGEGSDDHESAHHHH